MQRDSGGAPTSTTGLQHLPALHLRVVLDRKPSRRSHRSDAGQARAILTVEGCARHDAVPSDNRTTLVLRFTLGEEPEVDVALVKWLPAHALYTGARARGVLRS
jgi:hypothetical protein